MPHSSSLRTSKASSPAKHGKTDHSIRSRHLSASAVNQSLEDLGADPKDVDSINELSKGVSIKTRKLKENAFSTIVNLNDRWQRHKEKTAEIVKNSKRKESEYLERIAKLQSSLTTKEIENDKLGNEVERLKAICEELTELRQTEAKAEREKKELEKEMHRVKYRFDEVKNLNAKNTERIRVLEEENGKLRNEHKAVSRAFSKMEQKARNLESELKETRVELDMFEEMLSAIPRGEATFSSMSDFELSPVGKGKASGSGNKAAGERPRAADALADNIGSSSSSKKPNIGSLMHGLPLGSSTPLVQSREHMFTAPTAKTSLTSNLRKLAADSKAQESQFAELAQQAEIMKRENAELSRLLNESVEI